MRTEVNRLYSSKEVPTIASTGKLWRGGEWESGGQLKGGTYLRLLGGVCLASLVGSQFDLRKALGKLTACFDVFTVYHCRYGREFSYHVGWLLSLDISSLLSCQKK